MNLRLITLTLFVSLCLNGALIAQTPADDPGIGGPGTSDSAPAGDGAPIVPFDTNLSICLLVAGIYYSTRKMKILELSN